MNLVRLTRNTTFSRSVRFRLSFFSHSFLGKLANYSEFAKIRRHSILIAISNACDWMIHLFWGLLSLAELAWFGCLLACIHLCFVEYYDIISKCFDDWLRQAALEAVVRGPKKKKGGAGGPEVVASEDVINIWKDRTDPVRPTDISQSIEILFLS